MLTVCVGTSRSAPTIKRLIMIEILTRKYSHFLASKLFPWPLGPFHNSLMIGFHIYVAKLLTTEKNYDRRNRELLRVHAQHTEKLLNSAILSNKVILDLSQWTKERTVDEL